MNKHQPPPAVPIVPNVVGHDKLLEVLRQKIFARTIRAECGAQTLFKKFGKPVRGVTYKLFHDSMEQFGIFLTEDDCRSFFRLFDRNGTSLFYRCYA
jgi:hypothetical protein